MKYWGYPVFRPLQEDIILSVLDGNDTLALLPTSGGKSICYQVPAMALPGICVVITPLIALMKDQASSLEKKGILAATIYSGMSVKEIDMLFDRCVYGNYKFLFVSPERLTTEIAIERIRRMNVNLLAVDEAHCISQWGYDFRPPYLKIAEFREYLPKVPVLALTATATKTVVTDIQQKLNFKKENVLQKSFERKNLVYAVIEEEDKLNRLLRIISKVQGAGIIYVRSRRKTKDVADFLIQNNVSANYYHAGLDSKTRDKRQEDWMRNKTRVIVCTNAFGMGIDKPDVRFVVHLEMPDSVESYFQEAGRCGRDEKKAFAVLLHNKADDKELRNHFLESYPTIEVIQNVYQCLGNYFKLAEGSGKNCAYDFDMSDFSFQYNLKPTAVFNAIRFLEKEGYILSNDAFSTPSKIHALVGKDEIYKFQVLNPIYVGFVKHLLRTYGGLFSDFIKIDETELASRLKTETAKIIEALKFLDKHGIFSYVQKNEKPQLIYLLEKINSKNLTISPENLEDRKKIAEEKIESMISFASTKTKCRSQFLLSYFGEKSENRCGVCDLCIQINKLNLSKFEYENIMVQLKPMLQKNAITLNEIVHQLNGISEDKIIRFIQWLRDNDQIREKDGGLMFWNE